MFQCTRMAVSASPTPQFAFFFSFFKKKGKINWHLLQSKVALVSEREWPLTASNCTVLHERAGRSLQRTSRWADHLRPLVCFVSHFSDRCSVNWGCIAFWSTERRQLPPLMMDSFLCVSSTSLWSNLCCLLICCRLMHDKVFTTGIFRYLYWNCHVCLHQ